MGSRGDDDIFSDDIFSDDISSDDTFRRAMDGVEPLGDRERASPPHRRSKRQRRRGRPPASPGRRRERQFRVESWGEQHSGRAPGVGPRTVSRLRRGVFGVDRTVDLHGMNEERARREVRESLLAALEGGQRCVRIIHGRGLGSGGFPVLKAALPGWLAEEPLADRVVAFATAPAELGGAGATLVLLRPERRR